MGVACEQCFFGTLWMLGNAALAAWNRRVRMEDKMNAEQIVKELRKNAEVAPGACLMMASVIIHFTVHTKMPQT